MCDNETTLSAAESKHPAPYAKCESAESDYLKNIFMTQHVLHHPLEMYLHITMSTEQKTSPKGPYSFRAFRVYGGFHHLYKNSTGDYG